MINHAQFTTPEPTPNMIADYTAAPTFAQWLDTYLDEKGIDTETLLHVQGPSGLNIMPLSKVIEALKDSGPKIQRIVKTKLVGVDFINGNPLHFFRYAAAGLAL